MHRIQSVIVQIFSFFTKSHCYVYRLQVVSGVFLCNNRKICGDWGGDGFFVVFVLSRKFR